MKNLAFCGIPYNQAQFNQTLDSLRQFNEWFVNAIFSPSILHNPRSARDWENFYVRIIFLSAHLNNLQSGLCVAFLGNPTSYLSHLMNVFTISNDLEQHKSNVNLGLEMFKEFFERPVLMLEILNEFDVGSNLKFTHFEDVLEAISSSDIFMLRSLNSYVEVDSFSVRCALLERIKDVVSFISAFNQIVSPSERLFFSKMMNMLSMQNASKNKFIHLLLFKKNNPISKWILCKYLDAIRLPNKNEFIGIYLDLLLDPEIYTYLFVSIKPYNRIKKLRLQHYWYESSCLFSEMAVKNIFLSCFHHRHIYNEKELLYPSIATISTFFLCAVDLGKKLMRIFNITLQSHEQVFQSLDSLIFFTMTNHWYKCVTGEVPSENKLMWLKNYMEKLNGNIFEEDAEIARWKLIEYYGVIDYTELLNLESESTESAEECEKICLLQKVSITTIKKFLKEQN